MVIQYRNSVGNIVIEQTRWPWQRAKALNLSESEYGRTWYVWESEQERIEALD